MLLLCLHRCATLLKLSDVGHFAFLDFQTLLQQSACRLGKENTADVRKACTGCLSSFAASVQGREQRDPLDAGTLSRICSAFGLKHELHVKQA